MQGQPNNENNTENCAQMVVFKGNSTVMLEDRKCSTVSALACQVGVLLYFIQVKTKALNARENKLKAIKISTA